MLGCAADGDEDLGRNTAAIYGGVNDLSLSDPLSQARRDAVVGVNGSDFCTGTLVTPRLVVTAYHCVDEPGSVTVRFGAHFPGTPDPPGLPADQSFAVRACRAHPEALDGRAAPPCLSGLEHDALNDPSEHDLAVLVLARRVELERTGNYPAVPMQPLFERAGPDSTAIVGRFAGFGYEGFNPSVEDHPAFRQVIDTTFDFSDEHWNASPFIRAGDSGGPVEIGDPDTGNLRLAGVLSGTQLDPALVAAGPNLNAFSNRAFLEPLLATMIEVPAAAPGVYQVWTGPVDVPPRTELAARSAIPDVERLDPDGDGLVGEHDNCPLLFNPDQADDDDGRGDGIGDVEEDRRLPDGRICRVTCITASDLDEDGIVDHCHTVEPTPAMVPVDNCPFVPNLDQADCDGDGVGDACTEDSDGDGVVDPCDGCPGLASPSLQNCNGQGELADRAPRLFDPCDPNPCANGGASTTTTGANDLIAGEAVITTGEADSVLAATMLTGFRFCPCTFGPGGRTGRCEEDFGCVVRREEFSLPTSPWRPMTLSFSIGQPTSPSTAILRYEAPSIVGLGGPPDYEATWDFRTDATAAGTLVMSPGGAVHTSAMFWSLAVDYAIPSGLPVLRDTCNFSPAGCPPTSGNLNSHYWAATVGEPAPLRFRREDPEIPPIAPAFLPDGVCPNCAAAFPTPMLTAKQPGCAGPCPPPEVFARFGGYDFDITENVAPVLAEQLASGDFAWVAPVEPPEMLELESLRLVGIDPITLELRTIISASTGMLSPPLPQGIDKIGDPPGAVPILRATRNQYLVVGGVPAPQALQAVDLTRGDISWWPLSGALPTDVAAATVDMVRRRMYVVDSVESDRPPGRERRLLVVDLDSGVGTVLLRRPATPIGEHFALAAVLDGSFVLSVGNSSAMRHTLHWLSVDREGVLSERGVATGDGLVLGQMSASGAGVSRAVQTRRAATWQVVGTRWVDFRPSGGRALDLF